MADKKHKKKQKEKRKGKSKDDIELYKHYETFYEAAPPGYVRVEEEKPEDCIPNLPENEQAREFLSKAPSKGLWMPLGKEVKVMKCWRCKSYGHRTGDRECPMFVSGNQTSERFRMAHEDPMHDFIVEKKKTEKEQRIEQLKALLEEPTTSESDDSSDESSNSEMHHKHKNNKKGRKRKHKGKRSDSSSDTTTEEEAQKEKTYYTH
ncbi:retinitis pigmentosa 9 protein-like [Dendronephthya gigantea]|uniref:retinitis pigmentosa 9 protein-like n=1 Tax=Dendronephthya gigantea TaxID=151771 RepID=UPI00106D60CF|nr:retinitis pigmentosa 9 protein-like [Dendronephthya gigantea]